MIFHRMGLAALVTAVVVAGSACADAARARQRYLESGDRYFSEQKFSQALIEYRNSIKEDPAFGEARRALAETYFKLGQPERGFKEYMRAADLLPDRPDVQVRAGNLLLLSGAFDDAKQRAEKVLAQNPKDVGAQVLLGNALGGLQDMDGAFTQIEEAAALDPKNSAVYGSLATLELTRGNRDKAEAAFLNAVRVSPDSPLVHVALGNFYWSTGDVARAEKHLLEAVSLDPKDGMPRRALALLYLTSRKHAQAETHLQELARQSTDVRSTLLLADYYALLGKPDRAKQTIEDLERARGQSVATRLRLARIAYDTGNTARGHEILQAVLAQEPNQYDALLMHGRWLLAEGQASDALMRGRAAVAVQPKSASAHYLVGTALAAEGRNDQAYNEFTQVLKLNPRATPARVEMARLYLEDGATDEALAVAEEALRVDPANPTAKLALARTLLMKRDLKKAEPMVRSLVATYPKVAAAQALLGAFHLVKNDGAAARGAFERAAAIDPSSAEALAGLVRLDVAAGRTADARARIDAQFEKRGKSPDFLVLAAATYIADGAMPQAEKTLRTLIDLAPTNMDAYAMLGQLYAARSQTDAAVKELLEISRSENAPIGTATMAAMLVGAQGNETEARERYRQILKQTPRAAIAANNLAWLYASSGENLDEALRLARTAFEELPNRAEVADTLGWIYLKKDLPSMAVVPLQRSATRAPLNPKYHYHLGLAYASTRQFDRARGSFERALSLAPEPAQATEIKTALAALPVGTPNVQAEKRKDTEK